MSVLSSAINQGPVSAFLELTHGMDVDCFLFEEELDIQLAWVTGLFETKYLTKSEAEKLIEGLSSLRQQMRLGLHQWKIEDDDIHMCIERNLTESLGDLGKKIHLGRSRNDLVATTMKLYLANRCSELSETAASLSKTMLSLSEKHIDVIVPAFTHSQAAQPVRMGHIWNYHAVNFYNDFCFFARCQSDLLNIMPLGSGAIAGTHIEIDLDSIATQLGFRHAPVNSIHGVSDRDWLIETAQRISLHSLHISRLCEDIIFLSSSPVGLIELPEAWASGSSMMPNKRNPDFFEICRAKAKRLCTLSTEVLTLNLGIFSGYSSDFHEQKRVLIEGVRLLQKITPSFQEAISKLNINQNRATSLLHQGHILATDVANDLVTLGAPFRDAYKEVANQICIANEDSKQIGLTHLSFEESVERRKNSGGTSRKRVCESINWLRGQLINTAS